MVFTTHVEVMIRSGCSVEILGVKKPSFWTENKETLSLHKGGSRERNKMDNFH